MPAPKRMPGSVYVMVPGDCCRSRELRMFGLRASRMADLQHRLHLYPQHLYSQIFTEEEFDREMPERCRKLIRRASCIWLCLPVGVEFDATSYQILMVNEGYLNGFRRPAWRPSRLPVYSVKEKPNDGGLAIQLMTREELSDILRANVADGMLQMRSIAG